MEFNNTSRYWSPNSMYMYISSSKIQMGSLKDYIELFEKDTMMLYMPERDRMGIFLGGLKMKIASIVKIFKPMTLEEAITLAKLQDNNKSFGEIFHSLEDFKERLRLSTQSYNDAEEIIQRQRVIISDLGARLSKEKEMKKKDQEKSQEDLNLTLQRAHLEAQEKLKHQNEAYLKQFHEVEEEKQLLVEVLRSELENTKGKLQMAEKTIRDLEVLNFNKKFIANSSQLHQMMLFGSFSENVVIHLPSVIAKKLSNQGVVGSTIQKSEKQILQKDRSMQRISSMEFGRTYSDHSSPGFDNDDIPNVNILKNDVKDYGHTDSISFESEAMEPNHLEMNYESIESEKLHNRGSIIAEYGTEEISAQVILPFHQNPDENEVEKEPLPPTLPRSHVHSSCKMLIASFEVHEENEFIVKKDDVDLIHVIEESANGTNEKGVLNLEKEIEIEEYEDGNEVVDQVDDLNEVEMVIDYVDEANDVVLDECGAFNENDSVDGQYGLSNQEEEQNLQAHLSIDYYGDHNTVTHFQPSFQCSGASQFSYAHCEDGIAANRPSHALGSFEFGVKLVVINNVNSFFTSVDHGSQENGEMDYPVNRLPWEKSDHEVLLPLYIHDLVIDQNSPLPSSDKGDYELGPIGGIFMPDTISCQEGTLVKTIRNGRIKLFLPYGWSPDDNWIDMPTAQDASNIPCQSLNEIYGIPCQGVNQFFFGMSGYIIWGWYYKDNGNSFGILIEKFKQELSQNLQFGEHPGRWMIEWKIAWLMLLGNFCMTRLYAEKELA